MEFSSAAADFHVEFSDDGKWMILHRSEISTVYDAQTFEKHQEFTKDEKDILVNSFIVGASTDGRFIVTDKILLNLSTHETVPLDIDPNLIRKLALSPGGSFCAVIASDGMIHVFNNDDGNEVTTFPNLGKGDPSQGIFFGSDEKFLFVQSYAPYGFDVAVLWSVYKADTGTWVGEFRFPLSGNIQSSADYYFLSGDNLQRTESCDLHVYRIWPQEKINIVKITSDSPTCKTYKGKYASEKFFGDLLVVITYIENSNERDYHLNAWNVESGEPLLDQTSAEPVFILDAQKDGQYFAFYKPVSGTIEIVGGDGRLIKSFNGFYDLSNDKVIHSIDGKLRALVNEDTITLVDTSNKSVLRIIRMDEQVNQVVLLPNNDMLVKTFDGLWHYKAADNSLRQVLYNMFFGFEGGGITLLPDNRQFFVESYVQGFGLSLYDLETFQRVRTFDAPGMQMLSNTISLDGKRLALSGFKHKNVFVFDIARGTVTFDLPVLKFVPFWLQFTPDGQILYLAGSGVSSNTILQTWDMQNGKQLSEAEFTQDWLTGFLANSIEPEKFNLRLSSLSLSPDGDLILLIHAESVNQEEKDNFNLLAYWRLGEEKPFAVIKNFPLDYLPAFSADGRFLIVDSSLWGVRP
jgi:WD40 repeat protein